MTDLILWAIGLVALVRWVICEARILVTLGFLRGVKELAEEELVASSVRSKEAALSEITLSETAIRSLGGRTGQ